MRLSAVFAVVASVLCGSAILPCGSAAGVGAVGNSIFEEDASRSLSYASVIRAIRAKGVLPPALIPDASLDALLAASAQVPAFATSGLILEVRGGEGGAVDFSVSSAFSDEYDSGTATVVDMLAAFDVGSGTGREVVVEPRERAAEELAHALEPTAALLRRSHAWRKVAAIARRYSDKREELGGVWDDLWLEFDVSAADVGVPSPSVFLGPAVMSPDSSGSAAWSAKVKKFMLEFVRMYNVAVGEPLPRAVFASCVRAVEAIPAAGELHQLGVWLARDASVEANQAVRVIAMMPNKPAVKVLGDIRKYINDINYAHTDTVMETVTGAARFVDEIIVSADVWEDGALGKIGFECFIQKKKGKIYIWQRTIAFISWLKKQGMVTEEKARAVRTFMGFDRSATLDRGVSELPLTVKLADGTESAIEPKMSRSVNHIKIVYDPAKGWEAKFYLWITEVPREKGDDPEDFLNEAHDAVSQDASELVI